MRGVLLSNSKCFSEHPRLLIDIDGLLRFLGIDECLLSLLEIFAAIEMEFCLVEEHLVDTLWMVLSSH